MTRHTVLIADDEPYVLNALTRLLKNEAYTIMTTTDSKEVLEVVKTKRISLVVADHDMPTLTGVELFKILKRIDPTIIRIILTGKADMDDTIHAINEGEVFRFITKPWDDEDLKLTIRHALMQRDLWVENRTLLQTVRQQHDALEQIEKAYPGITKGPDKMKGSTGVYTIREEDLPATMDELIMKYFPPRGVPSSTGE